MSDAQWVLDISANLSGADVSSKLDEISQALVGADNRAEVFKAAIGKVAAQLESAKLAADTANEALALSSVRYAELERDAVRAAKAVEKSQNAGKVGPSQLAQDADKAAAALHAYAAEHQKLEKAAAGANAQQGKLVEKLKFIEAAEKKTNDKHREAKQQYRALARVIADVPGPLGRLGAHAARAAGAHEGLQVAMGGAGASSAALGVAVLALAAAEAASLAIVTALTVKFADFATEQADASRNIQLTRVAFGGLDSAAKGMVDSFDDVQESTGLSEDRLLSLSKQVRDLTKLEHGYRVGAGQTAALLKASAQAEAALGQGGADEFIRRIDEGRLSVKAFADMAEAKFGPVVQAKLLSLDAQAATFKRRLRELFLGVNVEPVLNALSTVVGIFDRLNPTGQALMTMIDALFGFISDHAETAGYAVEAFVIGFEKTLLRMYILLKPAIRFAEKLFGLGSDAVFANAERLGELVGAAFTGLTFVVLGLAAAFLPLAVFATLAALAILAIPAVLVAIVAGIAYATVAIGEFIGSAIEGLVDAGADMMKGLARGIVNAAHWVEDAVTDVVNGVVDTAKSILGIHSPSRVFFDIGDDTAQGYSRGLDSGADDAQDSMADLTSPADSAQTPAKASNGRARPTVDLSGATFHFHGVKDGESAKQGLADLLTLILEDDGASLAGAQVA